MIYLMHPRPNEKARAFARAIVDVALFLLVAALLFVEVLIYVTRHRTEIEPRQRRASDKHT